MSEIQGKTEIDYFAPISTADLPMLSKFGAEPVQDANVEEWVDGLDALAAKGSFDLRSCELMDTPAVLQARRAVINHFTALKSGPRDKLVNRRDSPPPPSYSLIGAMRALYGNRHELDSLAVVNENSRVLLMNPTLIDERLDGFVTLGLETTEELAAIGLTFPTESLGKYLRDLSNIGLHAKHVVNACSHLLKVPIDNIQKRLDNLTSLGLNALEVANAVPLVLKYSPAPFRKKFLVVKTAYRYWGAADAHARAVNLLEEYPELMSYSPQRTRVLVRIGSALLPASARDELEPKEVRPFVIQGIEDTFATYLIQQYGPKEERRNLGSINDLRAFSRANKSLGKNAIQQLIQQHPDDPIIKFRRRQSKADKNHELLGQ